MAKTSTLIYLMNDFDIPSDMLLFSELETVFRDEQMFTILDLLETDPGNELVSEIMKKTEV